MNNPEVLKCPCCGNLPEIYGDNGYYWCHCTCYACDWPYAITASDKADAIRGWNDAVLEYKDDNNEQTYPEEKDNTET